MKDIVIKGIIGYDVFAEDVRIALPAGSGRVRLLINSPGGDVFEAFEIYNLLKEYPGKVTARITGLAASAAADLFFGADEREWYAHSALMTHRAWTITTGNAPEHRKQAEILDAMDSIRIKDFARAVGKTPEKAMEEFDDEAWFVGDENIRAAGIAGTLVDGEEESEKITRPDAQARIAGSVKLFRELTDEKITARNLEKYAALARPSVEPPACAGKDNSHEGETEMDLKEFLAKNPGAEGEVLAYARTKIGPDAETARKAESERIQGILALAGVKISDDVSAALAGGTTPEAYAVAALKKQREIEAKLNTEFAPSPAAVPQTPGEQAGGNPETPAAPLATEESVKAYAASLR
jgi:ATP-dependent protease ClpP protease subunit